MFKTTCCNHFVSKIWQWKSYLKCWRMYHGSMIYDLCMMQLLIVPIMLSSFWTPHYPDWWKEWNVLVLWPLWLPEFTPPCTCGSIWKQRLLKKLHCVGQALSLDCKWLQNNISRCLASFIIPRTLGITRLSYARVLTTFLASFCRQSVNVKALLCWNLINQH